MDTSIRPDVVNALLGKPTRDAGDVLPHEWAYIIEEIIRKHAGALERLPGYKPTKERMNGWQGSSDRPKTDLSLVVVPEGFSIETKCLHLARVSHEVEGEAIGYYSFGVRFVYEKDLYLSYHKRILLSERKYERVFTPHPDRQTKCDIDHVTQSWRFRYCEGSALADIITANIALQVIDTIGTGVAKCVLERQVRLKHMEEFHNQLCGIKDRINDSYQPWQSMHVTRW